VITGCVACRPDVFERSGPRESEGHFAVRFGDVGTSPTLEGRPITDVIELQAGPDGWAIRLSHVPPPIHDCACGSGQPELVLDEQDGYGIGARVGAEL
jgi:hypothetical protein